MALTDTLDDLISERRIEPQLAMKILANFDRSITEVLADKVKARLTFKVLHTFVKMRGNED
jgi:transcription initiation factor TFIIA small subunit